MNAWPMIARCKLHQWQGLTEGERADIEEEWDQSSYAVGVLLHTVSGQCEIPIWTVDHVGVVMGVKVG